MHGCPLEDILSEISRQTGIRFSYSPQEVDVSCHASLNAQRLPAKDALRLLLGSRYEYKATRKLAILQRSRVTIEKSQTFKPQKVESEIGAKKVEYSCIANQRRVKKLRYTDGGTVLDDCLTITNSKNLNSKNSEVMKRQLAAVMLVAASGGAGAQAQQPSTISGQLDKAGKNLISLVEEAVVGTAHAVKLATDEVGRQAATLQTATPQVRSDSSNVNVNGGDTAAALKVAPETPPAAVAAVAAGGDSVRPVIFTFFYPFSFPDLRTERYAYSASFSWLYGINGGVSGAELGGLVNINRRYMSGVQLAGIANLSCGSVTGAQLAGIVNLAARDTATAQLAGIANVAQSAKLQSAGIANVAYGSGKTQLAGIANLSAKGGAEAQLAGITNAAQSAKLQAAGIANLAYGSGKTQLAGIANLSAKGANKAQLAGIANVADTSRCQVGLVNVARRAGVQVGLVNVCDTTGGAMVGLVNVARRGGLREFEAGVGVDNVSAAYRMGTKKFYTFAALSYRFADSHWLTGAGLGTQISLRKNWGINVEGASQQVLTSRFWEHGTLNQLSQVRVLGSRQLAKHFAVFAGPVLYVYNTNTSGPGSVNLKVPYTIYSGRHGSIESKVWVGFAAGIRL
jgi:hypothetical protein